MDSTTSSVSLIPAVSISFNSIPLTSILSSMLSLVVPAILVTIALSLPDNLLSREDLPTFAIPTIATEIPFFIYPPTFEVFNRYYKSIKS